MKWNVPVQINGSASKSVPEGITLLKRELWVGSDGSLWVGTPGGTDVQRIIAGGLGDVLTLSSTNTVNLEGELRFVSGSEMADATLTNVNKLNVSADMYGDEPPPEGGADGDLFFKIL